MKTNETSTQTIWDMINNGVSPDDLESVYSNNISFSDFMNDYLSSHPSLTDTRSSS